MNEFDFDVNSFMSAEYDSANSTERLTLADGGTYLATITDAAVEKQSGGPNGAFHKLVLGLEFTGAEVERLTKRDPFKDKTNFILDLTDEGGQVALDMSEGANVQLGQLRRGLGMNRAGEGFSLTRLPGRSIRVKHKRVPDKADPTKVYSRYEFLPSL